jgi:protein-S-isoprenylcysteine O-methyltransferase Ste14
MGERVAVFAFGVLAGFVCMALPVIRRRAHPDYRPEPGQLARPAARSALGMAFGLVMGGFTAWTVLYGLLGPGPLGVRAALGWVGALGWAMMAAGLVLVAIGQSQMGASWRMDIPAGETPLVTRGLFSVVRNPIYAAMELMLVGLALATPSPWPFALCVALAGVLALRARIEERHLLGLHGEDYCRYAAQVGRFLPGLGRLRPASGADG